VTVLDLERDAGPLADEQRAIDALCPTFARPSGMCPHDLGNGRLRRRSALGGASCLENWTVETMCTRGPCCAKGSAKNSNAATVHATPYLLSATSVYSLTDSDSAAAPGGRCAHRTPSASREYFASPSIPVCFPSSSSRRPVSRTPGFRSLATSSESGRAAAHQSRSEHRRAAELPHQRHLRRLTRMRRARQRQILPLEPEAQATPSSTSGTA